jgi:hypothetical protein
MSVNNVMYNFDQIKDFKKMARDFSEGGKQLENLLLNLWQLNIKTHACCNHNKYISIIIDESSEKYLGGLLNLIDEHIFVILDKYRGNDNILCCRFAIYCYRTHLNEKNFFNIVNEQIMKKISIKSAFTKFPPIAGNLFDYINNDETCPKLKRKEIAGFSLSYTANGDYYINMLRSGRLYDISKENLSINTLAENLNNLIANQREIIKNQ